MFALISNDDILGHLAQMMGNLDGAGIHSAAWLATVLNSPWSLCDYADTLFDRNAEGD